MSAPIQNPLPTLERITLQDLEPIALGATFLGTGGGGDPYLGRLLTQVALERQGEGAHVKVLAPEALADEDFTMMVAGMGSPSVMVEKLVNLSEMEQAVAAIEQRLGREVTAILPGEMGGANSLIPVSFAAQRGVPVLDADGMGRAFPELQMVMFHVEGNPVCPMSVIGDAGECVIIEDVPSTAHAEALGRPLCVAMGGQATIAGFPMDGKAARRRGARHLEPGPRHRQGHSGRTRSGRPVCGIVRLSCAQPVLPALRTPWRRQNHRCQPPD